MMVPRRWSQYLIGYIWRKRVRHFKKLIALLQNNFHDQPQRFSTKNKETPYSPDAKSGFSQSIFSVLFLKALQKSITSMSLAHLQHNLWEFFVLYFIAITQARVFQTPTRKPSRLCVNSFHLLHTQLFCLLAFDILQFGMSKKHLLLSSMVSIDL